MLELKYNNVSQSSYILLVDDDPDDILIAKEAMFDCSRKLKIKTAKNNEKVLDFLRKTHHLPLLIMLDLNMSKSNGFEVLQTIKSDSDLKKIPIIVFSSSIYKGDIEKSYLLGANSFINKPCSFSKLVEVIQSICNYWTKVTILPTS